MEKLQTLPKNILMEAKTPFAQAMPAEYKQADAIEAYRNYYIHAKANMAAWRNGTPTWWPKGENNALHGS
jgi:hypothetical protein